MVKHATGTMLGQFSVFLVFFLYFLPICIDIVITNFNLEKAHFSSGHISVRLALCSFCSMP